MEILTDLTQPANKQLNEASDTMSDAYVQIQAADAILGILQAAYHLDDSVPDKTTRAFFAAGFEEIATIITHVRGVLADAENILDEYELRHDHATAGGIAEQIREDVERINHD